MKHSKFLGVLAATLCLGLGTLAACEPPAEEAGTSTKHVHSAAADAAWEGDDNNHWKPCAAGDKGQVDKAKSIRSTGILPSTRSTSHVPA